MFPSRFCILTLLQCGRTAITGVPYQMSLLRGPLRCARTQQPLTRGLRRGRNIISTLTSNVTVKNDDDSTTGKADNFSRVLTNALGKSDSQKFRNHVTLESNAATNEVVSAENNGNADVSEILRESDYDLPSCTPALPVTSFNLAAYVNESTTLMGLVKLGVDLSKIEENSSVADRLVKMDFESDIKPVLMFLFEIGVTDEEVGKCISKNPGILCEPLDNMQVRVNYLESKKFAKDAIVRIVTMQPAILTKSTKEFDAQLGYLQKNFMLTGEEVRQVVTRYPKIALWNKASIMDVKLKLKDFMGFSEPELKKMLLACPKLYTSDKHALAKRFDYLHNVIGYSHDAVVGWPQVLRTRTYIIRQRHEFLKLLRRDNFDSTRENYVSPKALATGRDVEFCDHVAKVSVKQFNDFLKTL